MSKDLIILLQLSAAFLALFALAELLYRALRVRAEYTRKLVHTGTGLLSLLFPLYFDHLWQCLLICFAFLLLLLLSRRFHFLRSVNDIERKSSGSILYPVIVSILFAFYGYTRQQTLPFGSMLYFYLPLLLMAICDPVAALSGAVYRRRHPGSGKTIAGTAWFFGSALLLSFGLMYGYNEAGYSWGVLLLLAILLALFTAITERVSGGGWDNFTIPLAAALLLYLIPLFLL